MKKVLILFILVVSEFMDVFAQSYNQERIALENFLVRMYKNASFEGVKIVSDYNNNYLLSVVLVKKIRVGKYNESYRTGEKLKAGQPIPEWSYIYRKRNHHKDNRKRERRKDG